ncbi:ASTE1 [Branchiostoma lanceolatum]|uniref:ASTE1 protein n=1 Tax=Branchiostoma lanceolatum TaxID=7740 RepID=A0A8K0A8H4_BRALA|nr:ASTE1 [Branchiostoma lanceolatum]
MGILGFTKFIEDNPHLFTDRQLCNTRVVIDGNNLCYRLYFDNGLDVKHGGEYEQFSNLIKLFFNNLRTCHVEPYVIYDGAYESNDHKFVTTLDRSKRRILLSETIARDGPGHLLPALASATFKQVVSSLGVRCAQCDYEADREVVMLANSWNCPVISVDSDFFIFNIRAGYIPLNHLYWRSVCKGKTGDQESDAGSQNKGPYLRAQVYTVDNFCSSFDGLQVEMLPLLGTLLGNDYLPVTLFLPFYSQIKLPKGDNVFFSRRYARAYGVISWLQERENLEDALHRVLNVFRKSEREDYKMMIQSSMVVYTFFESYLPDYFASGSLLCRLLTHDGYPLPEWVLQNIRQGAMPTMCLNALANHRVFLHTQIEDLSKPSANTCSLPIRVAIYNILLSHDESKALQESPTSPKKSSRHTKEFCVQEYDRMGKDLKKTILRPEYKSTRYGCLPNLAGVSALCKEDRKTLLLEVLGVKVEDISQIPPCLQFTIAVLCYWIRHANPKVSHLHLYCLLLCFIRHDILSCQDSLPTELLPEPIVSTSQQGKKGKHIWTPPKSWIPRTVSAFFDKFQKGSKTRSFDLEGVHGFAQFQSCMQYTIYLNKVLCLPFPPPDLAGLFSGIFTHELYKEMKNKADVLGWVMLGLGKTSQVAEEFYRLQTVVRQVVSEECFAARQQSKTARKKQKRRESSAASSSGYGEGSSSSSSVENEDLKGYEASVDVVASCSLENKFAGLMSLDCDN